MTNYDDVPLLLMVSRESLTDRNKIVFDGETLSLPVVLDRICSAGETWYNAGLLKEGKDVFIAVYHRWTRRK